MIRTTGQKLVDGALLVLACMVAAVLYAPLFLSFVYSVIPLAGNKLQWSDPTLDQYFRIWDDPLIVSAIRTTMLVGVLAVILSTVLGVICALYATSRLVIARWLIDLLVYLPFLLPPIITGLSLLIYFEALGIPRGLWTIVVGHTAFVIAIIYRLVVDRLESLPKSMIEAAADLGASRTQTFWLVIWPQIRPVVVTAGILAFALSFDETMITSFLAGTHMTLPLRLWAMMRVGFTPSINALVTIVIVVSGGLTLFLARRLQLGSKVHE